MPTRPSYLDADGFALGHAADWLGHVATGSVGTSIAVIAIAWTGFAMLQGRIDLRRAGRVIVGCFILFGAPVLAKGIIAAALGSNDRPARPLPPAVVVTPSAIPQFDPYAGAALPH